jgi:hypothetical protein
MVCRKPDNVDGRTKATASGSDLRQRLSTGFLSRENHDSIDPAASEVGRVQSSI